MKDRNHLDKAALLELQEVMEDEFSVLLETFLHDGKDRILQLLDAIQKNDADAFSRAAHSFKGSCTNIGVPYLAELCLEAEIRGKEGRMEGNDSLVGQIRAEFAVVTSLLSDYL
jgi:HPt (histidine-containing phosphotransfer) domain-containing protein